MKILITSRRASPEERFARFVGEEDPETGCLEWGGARHGGYGVLTLSNPKRKVYAHRFAYEMEHGPTDAPVIRHTCDNPACVKGAHLVAGTFLENMIDALDRGRRPTKLDADKVRDIRARAARGERGVRIAEAFGVTPNAVSTVLTGRSWKHVA